MRPASPDQHRSKSAKEMTWLADGHAMARCRSRSTIRSTTQSALLEPACLLVREAISAKIAGTASLTNDARRCPAFAPVCRARSNATRRWCIRRSIGEEARTVSCDELPRSYVIDRLHERSTLTSMSPSKADRRSRLTRRRYRLRAHRLALTADCV